MKRMVVLLVVFACGIGFVLPVYAAPTPVLMNTIDTWRWRPPSPDPSGITYWPRRNSLMVVDGEVDETPLFKGFNIYEATLSGNLIRPHSTKSFSKEPVGIDIEVNPKNDHFFISDDNLDRVFDVHPGGDRRIGRGGDDKITSFRTSTFGCTDPEGLTFVNGKLFIIDGAGAEVYILDPGPNGLFEGMGDDKISQFDVGVLGIPDPEGGDYNAARGTLYLISTKGSLFEITTDGKLINTIALPFTPKHPSDVTLAPSSANPSETHLYITDRGVDNNADPNENDGKIYEVALP
jgi:hypothetical protein